LSAELASTPRRPLAPPADDVPAPPDPRSAPLRLEPARCALCATGEELPIAVGEDFEYRTSPDTYLAVRCSSCGLVYLRMRPADAELDRVYPPEYHAFDFSAEKYGLPWAIRRRLEARRLLRFCRSLTSGARILDVGCGDGFHLKLLREHGDPTWQLEGVDPSDVAVEAARRSGLVVHHGAVESLTRLRGRYDLALLIATIEHVPDPVEVLAATTRLLRPGGRVILVTDNAGSWSQSMFRGRYWGGYHFPRHLCLFTPATLRRLADVADLQVVRLGTMLSPVNWVYSVRNALVDLRAPGWLVERFSLASPGSLAAFTVVGMVQQLFGRGELLWAELQRPEVDNAA
jgi:SAM-dependent methyltransferase